MFVLPQRARIILEDHVFSEIYVRHIIFCFGIIILTLPLKMPVLRIFMLFAKADVENLVASPSYLQQENKHFC